MSTECETVDLIVTRRIEDVDGEPIHKGSVLRHLKDGVTGVVTRIIKEGDFALGIYAVGDLEISTGAGTKRISNMYRNWRHLPRDGQTYVQRLESWSYLLYDHDEDRDISKDEGLAIDGVMALLPEDMVDWVNGPWPDTIDGALGFLAHHLDELRNQKGAG